MGPDELIKERVLWHHAVEYIKQDLSKVETLDVRFPAFPAFILRMLGSQAYAKEQDATKELRAIGARIVKEKVDQGELFVVWSHRGNTDIFRIHERKLRLEVQKKIDELSGDIIRKGQA